MRIAVLLLLIGVAVATGLVAWFNTGAILATLVAIGWGGFVVVCGFHFCLIAINGIAWQMLTPDIAPRRWPFFVWSRLVRTAAADVLPLSQLGGPAAGIRLAILHGVPAAVAAASVIVDVAIEFLTQLAYAVLGFVMLIAVRPETKLLLPAAAWLLVAAGLCAAFFLVQRRGNRLLERFEPLIARHFSRALPGRLESITDGTRAHSRGPRASRRRDAAASDRLAGDGRRGVARAVVDERSNIVCRCYRYRGPALCSAQRRFYGTDGCRRSGGRLSAGGRRVRPPA